MSKTKLDFTKIQEYYNSHLRREVSEEFKISPSSITKWTKKGKLKCPRTQSESTKLMISKTPNYGRAHTPEGEIKRKENISLAMKGNPKCGGYRKGSGRGKKSWYESTIAGRVYLDSSYELVVAKWMDNREIVWQRNHIKFPYLWNGERKYYIPDFYLVTTDEYLEIKGYFTDKDLEKWKVFPYSLKILFAEDLHKMKLINEKRTFNMESVSNWRVNDIYTLGIS